jgi:3-deoxy-7-phosphoheptulonate synthase
MNILDYKVYKNNSKIVIKIGDLVVGKDKLVIAGPCTINDKEELISLAKKLKELGVNVLRGGAFKPRTNPYSFQGLEETGIEYLIEAKRVTGLPIISELTDVKYLNLFIQNVDIIQVGSKNMFNYELLKALGKTDKVILLKRNMCATYEEWLSSAEYIMQGGNNNIILCERGIRTFETETRNTLDLQAIPVMKAHTNLPIIIDPSHAAGKRYIVKSMAIASIAAGADGLIIETSLNPETEICDSKQTIDLNELGIIIQNIKKLQ